MSLRDLIFGKPPEPEPCPCVNAPPPAPKGDSSVAPTSPACILAKSLTDPETRGEWVKETERGVVIGPSWTARYRNAARDICLSRTQYYTGFSSGDTLSTPFTLTEAEEKVVRAALKAFDKHESDERERAALGRLTALAAATGTAKTAKRVECKASQSGAKRNARKLSARTP